MSQFVALLRGINVGGRNTLPMQELREIAADIGAEDVSTYIQSGNMVFSHASLTPSGLEPALRDGINSRCGFTPEVYVMISRYFRQVAEQCPFGDVENAEKTVHVFFLRAEPEESSWDTVRQTLAASESIHILKHALFLHAPDGIGRSKVVAKMDRLLGVSTTARNWRTVNALLDRLD